MAMNFLHPVWENDFFLHIRMGQDILSHHRLTGDPSWTFGPHVPWLTTMAVSEVLMTLIFNYFGFVGFVILQVLAGLALIPIFWICIGKLAPRPMTASSVRIGSAIGIFLLIVYSQGISARPQTISLLLFPFISLFAIRLATLGKAPRVLPIALMTLFWTWFHGYSLLVGPMLVIASCAYLGGAWMARGMLPENAVKVAWLKIRKQWLAILLPFLVPLFNPIGFNFYVSSWNIRKSSSKLISEWLPFSPYSYAFLFFSIIFLIFLWVLFSSIHIFVSKKKASLAMRVEIAREGLLLFGSYAVLAQSTRTAFLLVPLIGLLVAHRGMRVARYQQTYSWEKWESRRQKKTIFSIVSLVLVSIISFSLITRPDMGRLSNSEVPLGIYKVMNATPGQHRVLVSYNISSTVLSFVKNASTSIDGRTDRYGNNGARAYFLMCRIGKNWKTTLAQYPNATDAILIKTNTLVKILSSQGWTEKMHEVNWKYNYIWLIAPKK